MNEQKDVQKVLTESVVVQLQLSKAELEAYKLIAKKEGIALEQALNRTFHISATADIDSTFDGDRRGRKKMEPLWKQIEVERDQAWREQEEIERKNRTGETLTEEAWLYYAIPTGKNRIDVPVTLVLDRKYYERFMHLIGKDNDIFRDVVSSLANDKLEQWTGKYARVADPEVVNQIVQAVLVKESSVRKG